MKINTDIDLEANTLFTFEEYKAFIKKVRLLINGRNFVDSRSEWGELLKLTHAVLIDLPAIYRTKLPSYLLAYCPYCGGRVSEAIDTFSLSGVGWAISEPRGFGWLGRKIKSTHQTIAPLSYDRHREPSYTAECNHVRAVVYGVNLNQIIPDDLNTVSLTFIGSEKPGLLRPFMNLDGSYAVIHSLPIGRLDDPIWQPRYTAYFITYFNEDPHAFMKALAPRNPYDHHNFFWPYDTMDYNLSYWLELGQLFWLGPKASSNSEIAQKSLWGEKSQDLCLRQKPVADFPYGNIDGLTGRWATHWERAVQFLPNIDSYKLYHHKRNVTKEEAEAIEKRGFKSLKAKPEN